MADNVLVNPTGTTSIATDEVGGIQFQRVKVTYGDDGTATDVSESTPLPVDADIIGELDDAKVLDPDAASATLLGIARGQLQRIIDGIYTVGTKTKALSISVGPSSDGVFPTKSGASGYVTVAASSTAATLGAGGVAGDYIEDLVCVVATAATSTVTIIDGATSIQVHPNNVGGGIGTYVIPLGMVSVSGGWKCTTGAGVAVIAKGIFTA